jgi:hypothetical protein
MTDWHDAEDSHGCDRMPRYYQWAETDDPRVLVVIERDNEWGGGHIDGDVYAPAFYWDRYRGRADSAAGSTFMDDESRRIFELLIDARDRFRHNRIHSDTWERWAWIFHGTTFAQVSSSLDRDTQVVILNTPTWREHVGMDDSVIDRFEVNSVTGPGRDVIKEIVDATTEAQAREIHLATHPDEGRYITVVERVTALAGDVAEWTAALDGEVYGIGYATNEGRRLPDDEPIDLVDGSWDIDIQCWGFLGEDYAKGEALEMGYGSPDLPEMLPIEVPA